MIFKVKGKFEIEFSGVVEAGNLVKAEEKVAAAYRKLLEENVNVKGRPYDVEVKTLV